MSANKQSRENKQVSSGLIQVTFTIQEATAMIDIINIATQAKGLSVARACVHLSEKFETELSKIKRVLPANNGKNDKA